MSQFSHNQSTGVETQPPVSTGSAPPPIGYPTTEMSRDTAAPVKTETKSKGDGFLKGCLAAICCCCAIDICF